MGLFSSKSSESGRKQLGSVRYTGWEDRDLPEKSASNDEGDNVLTSRDANPRPQRGKAITGPSGHRYKFRGRLGKTWQWLPVYDREDLNAFRDADEYEAKRER